MSDEPIYKCKNPESGLVVTVTSQNNELFICPTCGGLMIPVERSELLKILTKTYHALEIGHPPPPTDQVQEAEDYSYITYTNKNREGEKLDDDQYYLKKEQVCRSRYYKFIIDEPCKIFWYEGENVNDTGREIPVRPAWRALTFVLVQKQKREVSYKEIYEAVYPSDKYCKIDKGAVHKWFSLFRTYLASDLKWLLKSKDNFGYGVKEVNENYCIFIRNKSE